MRMKRSLIAAIVSVIAMPPAIAPTMADDRALFYRGQNKAWRDAPMVVGGRAVIDEALMRIIPAPYRVTLDDSVPASLYLVWGNGDNWMDVLRRALAPIGLVATANWGQNRIQVGWRQSAVPVVPAVSPAVPVVPAPAPTPASAAAPKKQGFEIVQPKPAGVETAPRVPSVDQDARPAERVEAARTASITSPVGRLPSPKDMWLLMRAVVAGKKIVLTGQSGVPAEERRIQFANTYANKLRGRLLTVGFPPASVVVVKRDSHAERSRPGIKILIETGEV